MEFLESRFGGRALSDDEKVNWCWLRACEWNCWPGFLSQPLVPVLLLFFPLWKIVLGICAANVLWAGIRYRLVSVPVAYYGCIYAVYLKWPITIFMAAVYLWSGNYHNAIICCLWLPCSGLISICGVPGQIGRTQRLFMAVLGCEWDEAKRDRIGREQSEVAINQVELTEEEQQEVSSFFREASGGERLIAKKEHVNSIQMSFTSMALHLRAEGLCERSQKRAVTMR